MKNKMYIDIEKVLVSERKIKRTVKRLGRQISKEYKGKNLLLISVLKGAVVTLSDLMREISIPCAIDFMVVSSYGAGTETSGKVSIIKDVSDDLSGYDVLIIEDILDSGVTLSCLRGMLEARNPSSLKICTLFDKPARRQADIKADYVGITVPDAFIVGYGLDYNEKYRNLPYVGILKRSVYSDPEALKE